MLRFLSKNKRIFSNNFEQFYNIFYFLRYFPIIVLSNDWFLFDNYGLYYILSKFSLVKIIKALRFSSIFLFIFSIIILFAMVTINSYFFRESKNVINLIKNSQKNTKLERIIKHSTVFLFYILFYFNKFPIEICMYSIIRTDCNDKSEIYYINSNNYFASVLSKCTKDDFSYFSLIITLLFLLNFFMIYYFFEIYIFSPYNFKKNDFSRRFEYNIIKSFIFPFLNIFIFFEKLFFLDKHILLIKLSIRVIFLIILGIKLKNIYKNVINKFVLLIEFFCAFGILFDFITFFWSYEMTCNLTKDGTVNSIIKSFINNPSEILSFYEGNFLLCKYCFQFSLALFFMNKIDEKDIDYSSNIYEIKKNFYTSYKNIGEFHKFIYYIYNFETLTRKVQLNFLFNFYENTNLHSLMCNNKDCHCKITLEKFKNLDLIKEENKKIARFKLFLINILGNIVENLVRKNVNIEAKNQVEIILLQIITKAYLSKKYISAILDLRKLENLKCIRSHREALIKKEILKIEILKKNKKANKKFYKHSSTPLLKKLKKFEGFSQIAEEYQNSLKIYKDINNNFSKNERNRKMKIREFFTQKNFYDFENILEDFKSLIYSLKINNDNLTKIKNEFEQNMVEKSKIAFLKRFFSGLDLFILNNSCTEDNQPFESEFLVDQNNVFYMEDYVGDIFKEKDSIKLILKLEKDENFIFSSVPSELADDLEYSISDLIGKNIEFLIPPTLVNYHQKHVSKFLYNNNTEVKPKEVHLVSKSGYSRSYNINGTILLALNQEIIFYVKLEKITYNKDTCLICIDTFGDIIAYNKNIEENLFIDNIFMRYVKPNFFKSILDIQPTIDKALKNSLNETNNNFQFKIPIIKKTENESINVESLVNDLENENMHFRKRNIQISIDYKMIIEKLRKSDFNRITEYKYSNEFSKEKIDIKKLNYQDKLDEIAFNLDKGFKSNVFDNPKKLSIQRLSGKSKNVILNIYINSLDDFYFYYLNFDFSRVGILHSSKHSSFYKCIINEPSESSFNQPTANLKNKKNLFVLSDQLIKRKLESKADYQKNKICNKNMNNKNFDFNTDKKMKVDEGLYLELNNDIRNEKLFLKQALDMIKFLTIHFIEDKDTLEINLETIQIFVDSYLDCEHQIAKRQIEKSFIEFQNKNIFESKMSTSNESLNIKIRSNFFFSTVVILTIAITFYLIDYFRDIFIESTFILSDFSHFTIVLKSCQSLISSGILALYLVNKKIEKEVYYITDDNYLITYNNSIPSLLQRIRSRSDFFMNKFYYFRNIYLKHGSLVLGNNSTLLSTKQTFKLLSTNWETYNDTRSFFENLNLFHMYCNSFSEADVKNLTIDILMNLKTNDVKNKSPNKADNYIFYFLKNSLTPITQTFIKLILNNSSYSEKLINSGKETFFYVYLCSCLLILILLILQVFYINKKYKIILEKLYIISNYMKVFHVHVIKKLTVINDFVNDFNIEKRTNNCKNKFSAANRINNETPRLIERMEDAQQNKNPNPKHKDVIDEKYDEGWEIISFEKKFNQGEINIWRNKSKIDDSNEEKFNIENLSLKKDLDFSISLDLNIQNINDSNLKDFDQIDVFEDITKLNKVDELKYFNVDKKALDLNKNSIIHRQENKISKIDKEGPWNKIIEKDTVILKNNLAKLCLIGLNTYAKNKKNKSNLNNINNSNNANNQQNKKEACKTKKINKIKNHDYEISDSNVNLVADNTLNNSNVNGPKLYVNDILKNDNNLNKINEKNIFKPEISDIFEKSNILRNSKFLKRMPKIRGSCQDLDFKNAISEEGKKNENVYANTKNSESIFFNSTQKISETEEKIIYINYNPPKNFKFYKIIIYTSLWICTIIVILILILIEKNHKSIIDFYSLINAFISRNTSLFDAFFYLKMTFINKQEVNLNVSGSSSKFNGFLRSLDILDKNNNLVNQYYNNKKLNAFNMNTLIFFEESLQTKNFCEYYAYLADKKNLAIILDNIDKTPELDLEYLQTLKGTNSMFKNNYYECTIKSGYLFSSGLHEYINAAKYIMTNSMSDFSDYKKRHPIIEFPSYLELINNFFNKEINIKYNFSLRSIIFNIYETYLQLIDKSELKFRENLDISNDIINFLLMGTFISVFILNFFIFYKIIFKPSQVIDKAESIIKNTIYFKMV